MSITQEGPKVEIICNGGRRLVAIDGRLLPAVTALDTPHEIGGLPNLVCIKFLASEVHSRNVSKEEFEARSNGKTTDA